MSIEDKINGWIRDAWNRGASDIHFEPDEGKMRVRIRSDGQLKQAETSDNAVKILARLKIMADLDVNERDVPLDGRIKFDRWDKGCPGLDLRMSTLPCMGGEKVVLRLVDNRKLNMKLSDLGFSKKMLELYEPLICSPYGLILHVGPTGSGKTTSLYSVIQTLKKGPINIQTVEDPIEYNVFGITQTAVQPELGLNFPKVLRALLRQDPDVILVGEIRDGSTAEIAVEAAMTGHLVLSTLHTNDAVGTIVRLLDMGVAPYCISYALRCVVSQRFVRRLCEHCRKSTAPSPRVAQVAGSNRPIFMPKGCKKCSNQGYKGRVPLFELLPNSPALRKAVFENMPPDELAAIAARSGLISLWEDGLHKTWAGDTSLEEVLRVAKGVKQGRKTQGARRPAKTTAMRTSGVKKPAQKPSAKSRAGAARPPRMTQRQRR